MEKKQFPLTRQFLAFLVLAIFAASASAQKQLKIQEVGVRVPESIKIDGYLNEWPDKQLNAHNIINRMFYVVSNDDNNLYFTIRGQGQGVAYKVLNGGLVITISHSLNRRDRVNAPDNVSITFPLPPDNMTVSQIMGPVSLTTQDRDIMESPAKIDSMIAIANERLTKAMKEIRIVGVKEFPDSMISVYNLDGIKAATRFMVSGENRQPVYELAIPLKYLGFSVNDVKNGKSFSYNIRLNGPAKQIVRSDGRITYVPQTMMGDGVGNGGQPDAMPSQNEVFRLSPTDFWGVYSFAKE